MSLLRPSAQPHAQPPHPLSQITWETVCILWSSLYLFEDSSMNHDLILVS